jgi:hypothetical protein
MWCTGRWLGYFGTVSEYEVSRKRYQHIIENTKLGDKTTIPESVVTGV